MEQSENLVNIRVKIALLWGILLVAFLFHTQYELSELFVKTDIRMEGATGEMPQGVHYFRIVINFIPLLLCVGTLFLEKKWFKIFSLVFTTLFVLLNFAHLIEELFADKLDASQIILLSIVLLINVLLAKSINNWRTKKSTYKIKFRNPYFKKGLFYAGVVAIVSLVIGLLYGVIVGVYETGFFTLVMVGVIVTINFIVSILFFIFNVISYLYGDKHTNINRYISYSFAFESIFLPIFIVLKLVGLSF